MFTWEILLDFVEARNEFIDEFYKLEVLRWRASLET
jgi:hypothetical protein